MQLAAVAFALLRGGSQRPRCLKPPASKQGLDSFGRQGS